MSQPDFQSMNRKELVSYFLEHRNDQEAFYALMDKLETEPVLYELPPITTAEEARAEAERFPQILEEIRRKRQELADSDSNS